MNFTDEFLAQMRACTEHNRKNAKPLPSENEPAWAEEARAAGWLDAKEVAELKEKIADLEDQLWNYIECP